MNPDLIAEWRFSIFYETDELKHTLSTAPILRDFPLFIQILKVLRGELSSTEWPNTKWDRAIKQPHYLTAETSFPHSLTPRCVGADLFEDVDADELGLKTLKSVLQDGGRGLTQGGWDVHHIPEKWLWKSLGLDNLITANLEKKVPCIPLPGIGLADGNRAGFSGKFSQMFGGDPPYHRGTGGVGGKTEFAISKASERRNHPRPARAC